MEAIVGNWPEEMVSAGESVPDELEDWEETRASIIAVLSLNSAVAR